ncbi:MAG: hypothetical protein LBJ00_08455 [Planctomycetaceae bacterium]|jgi:hypothetical protein|nr:hypothetical protein [Planctomycetaceae bacterium]
MLKSILSVTVMLLGISNVMADVTVSVTIDQTLPKDAAGQVISKVAVDKNAAYSAEGSYNGKPPMNAEEKVTSQSWSYEISTASVVTCSKTTGEGDNVSFTASSNNAGTHSITVKMSVVFTITKYKPDMTTVISTRTTNPYTGTTTTTLDVWGKLTITADDYLPVKSPRREVKITVDATLTEDTINLTASDKLKLYQSVTGGTGSDSLNLTLSDKEALCYVESGESPSDSVNDQKLTASYSGTNVETVTKNLTVYELKVEAPGKMVNIGDTTLAVYAVPVMLNDDHDCAKEYTANWNCVANCPNIATGNCPNDTHRELEPVWDYLYIGECANEDDLVAFTVTVTPKENMLGTIKVLPDNSTIRVWDKATKGIKNSIISGQSYGISNFPKTFYIEGINIGDNNIAATYTPPDNKSMGHTELLKVSVVSLVETQIYKDKDEKDIERRPVINKNSYPIKFTVKGGNTFNGKFSWTIPGLNNGINIGSNNLIHISYGANGCSVILPEDIANRRFSTTISVSIDNKLNLSRTIRVAQGTYQGAATAASLETRRIQVPTLAILPPMDALTEDINGQLLDSIYGTDFAISGNASIRYATKLETMGRTLASAFPGANKKIYAVMLSKVAYDTVEKLEEIRSVAMHEVSHVRQFDLMRRQTEWAIMNRCLPPENLTFFMEAGAYMESLDHNTCWRGTGRHLVHFIVSGHTPANGFYTGLVDAYNGSEDINGEDLGLLEAMRSVLQSIYKKIPFVEMRKKGYDCYIRPPQPTIKKGL